MTDSRPFPLDWLRQRYWSLLVRVNQLPRVVADLRRLVHGLVRHGQSDYSRWADAKNLEIWWEARTERLARMVPPGSRVIEFGAGRCRLPKYLDEGCVYIASDLVAHRPDTVVCDLNRRPLPDLLYLEANVAVFAGVLEYLSDLPAVTRWLSTQFDTCLTSYDGVDSDQWTPGRATELLRRRSHGYLNHYEPEQLIEVFNRAGFSCVGKSQWESQELCLFVRRV